MGSPEKQTGRLERCMPDRIPASNSREEVCRAQLSHGSLETQSSVCVKNSGVHCRDAGKMKVTTFFDLVLNTNPVYDIPK